MDAEENARRASRGRTGANFRAKTGGVGDVLERGGVPGADYNAEVAAPVDDGQPVEGRVVADPNNNVVDGGLNLEASILAGVDVSGATAAAQPVSLGDETMDDLYAEIARKNNITIDDDSVVAAYNRDALRDRGPGPERAGNAGGGRRARRPTTRRTRTTISAPPSSRTPRAAGTPNPGAITTRARFPSRPRSWTRATRTRARRRRWTRR
jgi:hypothetical protein